MSRKWTLYRRPRSSPTFDPELFRHPTSEYRGVPFWSWNNRLDLDQLLRQIDQFREMGFGGVNIHSRTGLETEYLGREFMEAVRVCTERLRKRGMLCWLYDEDRWPSGFAGGLVTRDPAHRSRHLLWTPVPYGKGPPIPPTADYAIGGRSENGELLATFEVVLEQGRLKRYRRRRRGESARSSRGTIWYAYVETSRPGRWFGGQTYVDVFSKVATQRFIETTHERYREYVGDHFGDAVPAIFTDEPQFVKKQTLGRADDLRDVILPWSSDFPQTYRAAFGDDLVEHLPELIWNLPDDEASLTRWRYHEHTAEQFASGFGDVISNWCDGAGIALTGHVLGEGNLHSQTRGIGEAMRPLRSFHLPGIDILCDRYEWATAKQAQSVARQLGRPGVLSELYGVTNWDFTFAGHKAQGDWQAALGVTVRVPHLAWASMAGESKRDYPAAIGYQSPWWREYKLIEDHFARLNTVLTRGRPVVRVGVIHPIESYWLAWGPAEHNQPEWETREAQLRDICEILLKGLIDFDFISEGMLADPVRVSSRGFDVGEMSYDAVLLPNLRTMRSSTLRALEAFASNGGRVIFAGGVPELVDVKPSPRPARLAKRSTVVEFAKRPVLDELERLREVSIQHEDGSPADGFVHQLRSDGRNRYLFIVNTDRQRPRNKVRIVVNGRWNAARLDTLTAERVPCTSMILASRQTLIPWSFNAHDSVLLELTPARTSKSVAEPSRPANEAGRIAGPVPITLSEPNVWLLDQPEWRLSPDAPWQPREEILRIDNIVRKQFNLPLRAGRIAQPWTDASPAPVVAEVQLRFEISTSVEIPRTTLALEEALNVRLLLNRKPIPTKVVGWWTDEAIRAVSLPTLARGRHELILTLPMTRRTNLEWCYLLGNFGVRLAGRDAELASPIHTLAFGDWCAQGLPFYAGNVTYQCEISGMGGNTSVEFTKFKNPLLSVSLDGKPARQVAFAPYVCDLGSVRKTHRLDVTAFGNRFNAFGCLHHADEQLKWVGPEAWRSVGALWCYEYNLKPMGILTAPLLRVAAKA